MSRTVSAAIVAAALVSSAVFAQDGPLQRAGQALDNAGKTIRYRVETEIARGQAAVQDREVLHRVARRIEWDKQFLGSALRMEVRPGGTVVLQGSVLNDGVRRRAVDIVENTIGVSSVIDELAVVKEVKVIKAKPAERVIESKPSVTTETEVGAKP
jgi:hyperosmotically inducible periplasmic protein